ncbi:MAG: PAS domain S-box protein, partial [Thermodesulfobacteriota bacterium]
DITDRKRVEQALRESEEKYRTLVENSIQAVLVIQDFRIVYANKRCEEILGYTVEELLSLPPEKVMNTIHPDDRALVWGRFRDRLEGKEVPAVYRYRAFHKDGSVRWVEMYASPIECRGRPAVQAAVMDVTEGVLAQKLLEASEEKYRVVVENAFDTILALQDGVIRFANRRVEQDTGLSVEELLGRRFDDLIHPEDREMVREYYTRRLLGERDLPEHYLFRAQYRGAEVRWIRVRAVSITWEDRPAVLAFLRDVTRAKKTEDEMNALQEQFRQAQKMEAIGRLAGGVAHDFNNLLTVIKGTAQLSLYGLRQADPLRKNFEEIMAAADRAAALTRQLLAFSRRQVMEVKVIDINQLVQDLDKMLRRIIGEDIELVTFLQEGIGMVKADPRQIEQAIVNIAVNARDAMPEGGKLTIETANVDLDEEYARLHAGVQPGPYVMFSISDTGAGMSADVKERVFDPFFTTKEPGKGTGLGLSTTYGIVKQSNGHIWVYSEPGKGTTFKVYLPRVDEPVDERKKRPSGEVPRGKETILVVEDEDAVRELAVRILKKQGYKVLKAQDGGEALMLCEKHREPIDLFLSDVVMPGMSGREVVERLQAIHPEAKTLYMSGYTDNVIIHHGVLDKGTKFIPKPFTVEDLARKVREVLDE